MSRDLNLKKSWHPGLLKNQEIVWKREQEALEERKRIAERQKEIARERERDELMALQGQRSQITRRLDWMYADASAGNASSNGSGVSDDAEAYLLGKKRIDVKNLQGKGDMEGLNEGSERFKKVMTSTTLNSDSGAAEEVTDRAKLYEDPLAVIQRARVESGRTIGQVEPRKEGHRSSHRSSSHRSSSYRHEHRSKEHRSGSHRERGHDHEKHRDRPRDRDHTSDPNRDRYRDGEQEKNHDRIRSSERFSTSRHISSSTAREHRDSRYREPRDDRDKQKRTRTRSASPRADRTTGKDTGKDAEKQARLEAMMKDAKDLDESRNQRLRSMAEQEQKERERDEVMRKKSQKLGGQGQFIRGKRII